MDKEYHAAKAYLKANLFIAGTFIFFGFISFINTNSLWLLALGIFLAVWFWLAYKNYRLILTDTDVILKQGVLNKSSHEIPYHKIHSVSVTKGMFQRMLHAGNIVIMAGNDVSGLPFKNVEDPETIRDEISTHLTNKGEAQVNQREDKYSELERLASLRDKGVITVEEYDQKKKQLLQI